MRFRTAVPHDPRIDAWFAVLGNLVRRTAQPWYEQMRQCGAHVRELLHDGRPTACVEDVPFGYVDAFSAHINVGFFQGATLTDPAGLLEGTGKRMRHVKVRWGQAVDAAALNALIEAAYLDVSARLRSAD